MAFDHDIGETRNTRSMSLAPESPADYAELDTPDPGNGMILVPVFSGASFLAAVNFPVIVEGWRKKDNGRHKRRWEAEFTQAERNTISKYHGRFYKWHLVSGPPRRVSLQLSTLVLLQRAVNFFAGCG